MRALTAALLALSLLFAACGSDEDTASQQPSDTGGNEQIANQDEPQLSWSDQAEDCLAAETGLKYEMPADGSGEGWLSGSFFGTEEFDLAEDLRNPALNDLEPVPHLAVTVHRGEDNPYLTDEQGVEITAFPFPDEQTARTVLLDLHATQVRADAAEEHGADPARAYHTLELYRSADHTVVWVRQPAGENSKPVELADGEQKAIAACLPQDGKITGEQDTQELGVDLAETADCVYEAVDRFGNKGRLIDWLGDFEAQELSGSQHLTADGPVDGTVAHWQLSDDGDASAEVLVFADEPAAQAYEADLIDRAQAQRAGKTGDAAGEIGDIIRNGPAVAVDWAHASSKLRTAAGDCVT